MLLFASHFLSISYLTGSATSQLPAIESFTEQQALNRDALLALLDPNVVLRADSTTVSRPRANMQPEVRGREAVAHAFAGRQRP